MFSNKRGQIGETMTWVVATIIIIVILGIAIFIVSSSPFKGVKKLESKNIKADLLVTKSLLGYLSTENNYNELNSNGDFNEGNCELIKSILRLSQNDYSLERFAGIHENDKLINKESTCFEYSLLNYEGTIDLLGFWINVKLDKNKKLAIYLAGKGDYEVDE